MVKHLIYVKLLKVLYILVKTNSKIEYFFIVILASQWGLDRVVWTLIEHHADINKKVQEIFSLNNSFSDI
jgi:hypothetical protein